MLLAQAGEDLLHSLGVHTVTQGGVLFHQALQRTGDLALVALVFHFDGHGQGGHGEHRRRHAHHPAGRAQGVARLGRGQFRHRADVAGGDGICVDLLFTFYIDDLAQALRLAGAGVDRRGIGGQLAADHFHIAQFAHKGVGHGLENVRAQGAVGRALHLHGVAVPVSRLGAAGAVGAGQQFFDAPQHIVQPGQLGGGAAEHGRDGALLGAAAHAFGQLLLGKGLALEEFFHQLVAGLGHGFAHGLQQALGAVAVAGHRHLARCAVGGVSVGLFGDEVQVHAAAGLVHRDHHGAHGGAEMGLQVLEHFIEIRVFGVHLADIDHTALAVFQRQIVSFLRTHRQAAAGRYGDQHALGGLHALVHAHLKIEQAGRVQQVDLHAVILHRGHGQGQGRMPLGLFGVEVADGVAVFHTAQAVGPFRQIQQRLGQRRFAAARVAGDEDVADVVVCIVHKLTLLPCRPSDTAGNLYKNSIILPAFFKDIAAGILLFTCTSFPAHLVHLAENISAKQGGYTKKESLTALFSAFLCPWRSRGKCPAAGPAPAPRPGRWPRRS